MPPRPTVRHQVLIALALLAIGGLLLALPARVEGPLLVPISDGHGLSLLDTIGAVLLAVAVTWLEILVVVQLPALRMSPRALFGLGLLAGAGVGLLVASVFVFFWWWAIGAAAVSLALLLLVLRLVRR